MPKSSKLYSVARQRRWGSPGHTAFDPLDSLGQMCKPMNSHLKHFKRELPGLWTCLKTVSIGGVTIPSGARVIAGVAYQGVDVGVLLEQEYASAQKGPGPP
jgi:hypothetical protein